MHAVRVGGHCVGEFAQRSWPDSSYSMYTGRRNVVAAIPLKLPVLTGVILSLMIYPKSQVLVYYQQNMT